MMNAKRIIKTAGLVTAALLSTACSTIVNGYNQDVAVNTDDVVGAKCAVAVHDNPTWRQVFHTPADIQLPRGNKVLKLECEKDGYKNASRLIRPKVEPTTAGNVLNGGVVGIGVDAAAGALYKYPNTVVLPMMPE